MLVPRPDWNYSFDLADLGASYDELVVEYADYVPRPPNLLEALGGPFHIMNFPALERTNILLHCLLGHELGHVLANTFIADEQKTEFLDEVMPQIRQVRK